MELPKLRNRPAAVIPTSGREQDINKRLDTIKKKAKVSEKVKPTKKSQKTKTGLKIQKWSRTKLDPEAEKIYDKTQKLLGGVDTLAKSGIVSTEFAEHWKAVGAKAPKYGPVHYFAETTRADRGADAKKALLSTVDWGKKLLTSEESRKRTAEQIQQTSELYHAMRQNTGGSKYQRVDEPMLLDMPRDALVPYVEEVD